MLRMREETRTRNPGHGIHRCISRHPNIPLLDIPSPIERPNLFLRPYVATSTNEHDLIKHSVQHLFRHPCDYVYCRFIGDMEKRLTIRIFYVLFKTTFEIRTHATKKGPFFAF